MSRRSRRTRRTAAVLASLMIATTALPGVAAAGPAGDGLGPRAEKFVNPPAEQMVPNPPASKVADPTNEKFVNPPADTVAKNRALPGAPTWPVNPQRITSEPAPTVIRTVVREEAVRTLPIVLAGAALLIAIGGTGYALMRVAPRQRLGGLH